MYDDVMCDVVSLVCSCSFLDDAFRKNLESALRFGNPLLVQVCNILGGGGGGGVGGTAFE